MNVRIEVDYREKTSGILDILRNRNEITVEEKSLSIAWYIPVILSKDVDGTADFLEMTGIQDMEYQSLYIKRAGRKPKRLKRLKLHILQGLPQIGPKTANRMLEHFGSIEKAITAEESALASVEGIGKKKAAAIREIVR